MASTRAAVITVIITQPGTSPRSGSSPRTRSVSAARAAVKYAYARMFVVLSSSPRLLGQRDDADQPREQGEENGDRQHQEHDRDHHLDLLAAACLEQPALAR